LSARRAPRPSLSTQVLLGLVLGIGAGVFFGEDAGAIEIVGQAFIRLLQMTVIP
jgi:Na+/H+-dicarboxylate symporter